MSRAILGGLIIVCGIPTWAWIHYKLLGKDISIPQSRILVLELVPALMFSATLIMYLVPATMNLITGKVPSFAPQGFFWDLATFLGAVTMTSVGIGWVELLPEIEEEPTNDQVAVTDS